MFPSFSTRDSFSDDEGFDPNCQPGNNHVGSSWQPASQESQNVPSNTWNGRIIQLLNKADTKLEAFLPNFAIQNKLEDTGQRIKDFFAPLEKFNNWVDLRDKGEWHAKLGMFLVKLPLKVARNILRLVYNLIEAALFTAVHPLKALNKFVKILVELVHALTKPETWSKIGAGTIGASIGNALTSGNPFSLIGFAIGGALLIGGLSFGAIKAAVTAESGIKWEAVKQQFHLQMREIPESFLTGFVVGLIMGSIQKTIQKYQHDSFKVMDQKTAEEWARKLQDHGYPEPDYIKYVGNNRVELTWSLEKLKELYHHHPDLIPNYTPGIRFEFIPDAPHHAGLFENLTVTNYQGITASTILQRLETPFYNAQNHYFWGEPKAQTTFE